MMQWMISQRKLMGLLGIFLYLSIALSLTLLPLLEEKALEQMAGEKRREVRELLDPWLWQLDDVFLQWYQIKEYGITGLSEPSMQGVSVQSSFLSEADSSSRITLSLEEESKEWLFKKTQNGWTYVLRLELDAFIAEHLIDGLILPNHEGIDVYQTGRENHSIANSLLRVHQVDHRYEGNWLYLSYRHSAIDRPWLMVFDAQPIYDTIQGLRLRWLGGLLSAMLLYGLILYGVQKISPSSLLEMQEDLKRVEKTKTWPPAKRAWMKQKEFSSEFERLYKEWASLREEVEVKKHRIQQFLVQKKEQEHQRLQAQKELKEKQNEFKELKMKNQMMMESIDDVVWKIDKDGRVQYVNSAAEKFFSCPEGQIEGQPIEKWILSLKDQQWSLLFDAPLKQRPLIFDHPTGTFKMMTSTEIIKAEDGHKTVLGISRSIESSKRISDRVNRQALELQLLSEMNKAMMSRWTLEELLESILTTLNTHYQLAYASIHLRQDATQKMERQVKMQGVHVDETPNFFDKESPFFIQCLEEKRMVHHHLRQSSKQEDVYDHSYEAIYLPLETEGWMMGVLSVILTERITTDQMKILSAFALQISLAIERTRSIERMRKEFFRTLEVLVTAIEAKDPYTEGHSRRVSRLATLLADFIGLSEEEQEWAKTAGLLHDIGKIAVSDEVLTKKGPLTVEEYEQMKKHPEYGADILAPIGLPDTIMKGIRCHHRHFDGQGYPATCLSDDRCDFSALIGVVDALDAMTSRRSYAKNRSLDEAIEELKRCAGAQFSPEMVTAIEALYQQTPDRLIQALDHGGIDDEK